MRTHPIRWWAPALFGTAYVLASAGPARAASFDALGPAVRYITGPTVITEPGTYRVAFSLAVSTNTDGIVVRAPSVTLDLGGNTVLGPGGKQGRGIVVEGVSAVVIQNGRLVRWGTGVAVLGSGNVNLKGLQIVGQGLPSNPPGGDPPEIGVLIVNSRGVLVEENVITDVGLGLFVRGGGSAGNRLCKNTLTAGSNGLLGICYNPAPGDAAAGPGPRGDLIEENHIARFGTGIAFSAGSTANIIRRNAIAFSTAAMSPAGLPNNMVADNQTIQLP